MSRILVWSPNFAPELTGIPPLVTDAAEWLSGRGHEVDVVTAVPNYPERRIHPGYRGVVWRSERHDGVGVHRSWLRVRPGERFTDKLLYEATFGAFSLPNAVRLAPRADVLLCTVPCVSAALAAAALAALRRRLRLVLWVQDLVLRAALSLADVDERARTLLRHARAVEGAAVRAADRVVSCSPGFLPYLAELGVDPSRVDTILNWVDLSRIRAEPASDGDRPLRVLYTGNLGYTQGFETLLEAARLAPDIELEIVGAGNAAGHVRALAARVPNVRVLPPVPDHAYPALLASADVHVVVQRGVGADANFPSKIPSYLASGRPVVGSLSPASAAAQALRDSGAAMLVPPERADALAGALVRLQARPEERAELGRRGREYAERTFDREPALARMEASILG